MGVDDEFWATISCKRINKNLIFELSYVLSKINKFKPMDKETLLGKELSNLYAIHKQVNQFFYGSDISFLSERRQQIVMNYVQLSCKNEEAVVDMLRQMQINPGNTTDSVINEITENLHDITLQKVKKSKA